MIGANRISRAAIGALLAGVVLLAAGCGGSNGGTGSTESFSQAPPGRVPHAAPSNAHKEIPTQFQRAISLPYRSTVLYATAINVADPLESKPGGSGSHVIGVLVGVRNVGTSPWRGSVAGLSRLAVGPGGKPEKVIRSFGSSAGPCPNTLVKSKAPVGDSPLSLGPERTAFECVRFRLHRGSDPILFKFAVQARDYTLAAEEEGRVYAVWALPGTLVEKCRFEPSAAGKGRCQGLEDDEG